MRRRGSLVLAVLVMPACASDDSVVEPGILFANNQTMIEAPSVVSAGQPFIVAITTYGDGCTSPDSTSTTLTSDGAIITPYDRQRSPAEGSACTRILAPYHHEASLSFDSPGTRTLHVQGRNPQQQMVDIPLDLVVD